MGGRSVAQAVCAADGTRCADLPLLWARGETIRPAHRGARDRQSQEILLCHPARCRAAVARAAAPNATPPMSLPELLEGAELSPAAADAIVELRARKAEVSEFGAGARIAVLDEYC